MPSRVVGMGDYCTRLLRDKIYVNRSQEKVGQRKQMSEIYTKEHKSAQAQYLSRQLLLPCVAWKSLFVTYPWCPLLLQLNKERTNLAEEMRVD